MGLDEYFERMIMQAQRALDGQKPLTETVSGRITAERRERTECTECRECMKCAGRPVSRRGLRIGGAKNDSR